MPGAYLLHAEPMAEGTSFGSRAGFCRMRAIRARRIACGEAVDYFRLLFAYTDVHVPRTRKLEARSGSVQGVRGEYPGARGDHAVAADRCPVSALP
jgi:hypothetical protein